MNLPRFPGISARDVGAWAGAGALYVGLRFGVYAAPWRLNSVVDNAAAVAPILGCGALVALLVKGRRTNTNTAAPVMRRQRTASLVGLAVLVALEVAHRALFMGLPPGATTDPFDPAAWKSLEASDDRGSQLSLRQRMLGSVAERVLEGRGRVEIERDLGMSVPTRYWPAQRPDLVYLLGPARGISLDSEWLLVWLDGNGRFVRFEVAED